MPCRVELAHRLDQDVETLLLGQAADRTDAKRLIDARHRGPLLDAVRNHAHIGQPELVAELALRLLRDGDETGQTPVGPAEDRGLGRALERGDDVQRRDGT